MTLDKGLVLHEFPKLFLLVPIVDDKDRYKKVVKLQYASLIFKLLYSLPSYTLFYEKSVA